MRTYPLPYLVRVDLAKAEPTPFVAALVASGSATLAQMERASVIMEGTATAEWANKVVAKESARTLSALTADGVMPTAVLADIEDDDVVIALVAGDQAFTAAGWTDEIPSGEIIDLDEATAAFVATAFQEGAPGVILRSWIPQADLSLTAAGDPSTTLPQGARAVAVVDDADRNAVLELLAVAPGPKVYRRHAGEWAEDPSWLAQLRDPTPPPLVPIEAAMLASVESQVDEATAGQPFSDEEPVTASAAEDLSRQLLGEEHIRRADEVAIRMALLAAANPVKGAKGAEQLRQYWLHGKGAAKIRWGTPGDWRRCVRQLRKYLGVRANGYCQLMHGRATGTWAGRNHSNVPSPKVKAEAVAKQHAR